MLRNRISTRHHFPFSESKPEYVTRSSKARHYPEPEINVYLRHSQEWADVQNVGSSTLWNRGFNPGHNRTLLRFVRPRAGLLILLTLKLEGATAFGYNPFVFNARSRARANSKGVASEPQVGLLVMPQLIFCTELGKLLDCSFPAEIHNTVLPLDRT